VFRRNTVATIGSGYRRNVTTPDGCAVDLYALLPARGEPEVVRAVVPPGATILELGCGAGRITHPLLALGYQVVAVDRAADMLGHVRGARTVQASIEELDLGQRFDAVLLASNLVNTADRATRAALLASCARHVTDGGRVLAEWRTPEWLDRVRPAATDLGGGVLLSVRRLGRTGDLLHYTLDYRIGGRQWAQECTVARLDYADLRALLAGAGLVLAGWHSPKRSWFSARPAVRPAGRSKGP
jgi:SAM-dependent methyltransferase